MSKDLAGVLMIHDGEKYDYCYIEAIQCLLDFCDHVYVVDAGSTDGTTMRLFKLFDKTSNLTLIHRLKQEWDEQKGRQKLNYFTNLGIEQAERDGYKYQINCQADEIISEKSYQWIRKAIETGQEGFLCNRINLWGDPYHYLDVPQNRKPCSTEIIRLAKTCYRSYDDAESIAAPYNKSFTDFITFWHFGFVRDKKKMVDKSIHMQRDIFLVDPDEKLKGMIEFDGSKWFSPEDLKPIEEPLPAIIQQWAIERTYKD